MSGGPQLKSARVRSSEELPGAVEFDLGLDVTARLYVWHGMVLIEQVGGPEGEARRLHPQAVQLLHEALVFSLEQAADEYQQPLTEPELEAAA